MEVRLEQRDWKRESLQVGAPLISSERRMSWMKLLTMGKATKEQKGLRTPGHCCVHHHFYVYNSSAKS